MRWQVTVKSFAESLGDNMIFSEKIYDDSSLFDLENFGLFHLNIDDAAELICRILYFEGQINVKRINEDEIDSIFSLKLTKLLGKEIQKYKQILCKAIDAKTLKTVRILRDIEENIIPLSTIIKCDDLIDWLEDRNVHIRGDWYEDFLQRELQIAEDVQTYIQAKRIKTLAKYNSTSVNNETDKEKIERLEAENIRLRNTFLNSEKPNIKQHKPLHVKERETLLKLVIGMAINGYRYDPNALRSDKIPEIESDLAKIGISLDADTVRKWLKESAEILPRDEK
jgi:hypothetical protein